VNPFFLHIYIYMVLARVVHVANGNLVEWQGPVLFQRFKIKKKLLLNSKWNHRWQYCGRKLIPTASKKRNFVACKIRGIFVLCWVCLVVVIGSRRALCVSRTSQNIINGILVNFFTFRLWNLVGLLFINRD